MSTIDRVAVVTGGGRGIGRGIVGELAAMGFAVVVNYRADGKSAEATRREAVDKGSPRSVTIQADVSNLECGPALIAETLDRFGRIDVWVNNAGLAPTERRDLLDTSPESFDRVLGVNLRGPYFLNQGVARAMIDLSERGIVPEPKIIFVTSISSTFASVSRGEYCVSKAGLSMVAKLFAVRLADQGVRVYEVRPGIIQTDMTAPVRDLYDRQIADGLSPIRRWGTPGDVGKAVAALAGGSLPFSTGEVIHVDGGLNLARL